MSSPHRRTGRTATVLVPAVVLVPVLLLAGCSGSGGPSDPVATPTTSPTPTPSASPSPTPEQEFSEEVEELYALVKRSVEGSADFAGSNQVLDAFATSVGLVRVPPELMDEQQRVVDAAETAAAAYGAVTRITSAVERPSAARNAVVRLRELERVIRTLPE